MILNISFAQKNAKLINKSTLIIYQFIKIKSIHLEYKIKKKYILKKRKIVYNKRRGEKMKGFFKEFKEFISKGNVLDLAVAVVMGSAFGKIVSALVDNIIMPLFGIIVGENFAGLTVKVNGSPIAYGLFIQAVVDFIIIAFFIFLFTKMINKFKKKEEKKEEKKDESVELLKEIRDLLKKKK